MFKKARAGDKRNNRRSLTMGFKINVLGIKVYAYHGCLEEETKIGGNYIVDVSLKTKTSTALKTDKLNETIDYVDINLIVKEEMSTPSKLIEHVAQRILSRIKKEICSVEKTKVKITKLSPPINGNVKSVCVVVKG